MELTLEEVKCQVIVDGVLRLFALAYENALELESDHDLNREIRSVQKVEDFFADVRE